MERARNYIIISAQRESFSETIEHLQQKRRLEAKNKLIKFNTYLDQKHMLHSRSRVEFAPTMELESRHPLILLASHPTVKLYLQPAHQICMHQDKSSSILSCRSATTSLGYDKLFVQSLIIVSCVDDTKQTTSIQSWHPTTEAIFRRKSSFPVH